MAANIQVILKQDVDKLGRAGELVKVKPGFARNYLLPRGMAVAATGGNMKQIEHERRLALSRTEKLRKLAQGTAAQIDGLLVRVPMQAGEEGKLYGSVTSRDVADALHAHGVEIDRKRLQLPEAIKALGDYDITIKLEHGVTATFKLSVVSSG